MNKMNEIIKSLINFYISMDKLKQVLLNIIVFILILILCICVCKWLFVVLGRFYFNCIISLVLLMLVITDEKIKKRGKILLILIMVVQIIMFMYWDLLYIDLIKDMFWLSLILNIGVIWHNVILDRLLRSVKNENEWIRFVIIRLSWLTSITLWILLVKEVEFILRYINFFVDYSKFKSSQFILSKRFRYWWTFILRRFYLFFYCVLIESILWYFIEMFNHYSLFIMGIKVLKLKLNKELILVLIVILLTFVISIKFNIVRIYLIWVIMIVHKIIYLIYKEYLWNKKYNHERNTRLYLLWKSISYRRIRYHWLDAENYQFKYLNYINNVILPDWKMLFEHDMYGELLLFVENDRYCKRIGEYTDIDYQYFNIYDILYLFWYSGNIYEYKIRLVLRMDDFSNMRASYFDCLNEDDYELIRVGKSRIDVEWTEERDFEKKSLIERYGLNITLEDYKKRLDKRVLEDDEDYPLIIKRVYLGDVITLKEFLGLKKGTFLISISKDMRYNAE